MGRQLSKGRLSGYAKCPGDFVQVRTNVQEDICLDSRTSEAEQLKYLQGATTTLLGDGPSAENWSSWRLHKLCR